jgi:hypothetical protein
MNMNFGWDERRFNTNKFTSIKVTKTHMYRHNTIKNAKAWIKFKLIIVLDHVKQCQLALMFFYMSLKHCATTI